MKHPFAPGAIEHMRCRRLHLARRFALALLGSLAIAAVALSMLWQVLK